MSIFNLAKKEKKIQKKKKKLMTGGIAETCLASNGAGSLMLRRDYDRI